MAMSLNSSAHCNSWLRPAPTPTRGSHGRPHAHYGAHGYPGVQPERGARTELEAHLDAVLAPRAVGVERAEGSALRCPLHLHTVRPDRAARLALWVPRSSGWDGQGAERWGEHDNQRLLRAGSDLGLQLAAGRPLGARPVSSPSAGQQYTHRVLLPAF